MFPTAFFMCLESVFTVGCRLARDFGRICGKRYLKKRLEAFYSVRPTQK